MYRSTSTYTIENFVDPVGGRSMVQVTDSISQMIVAILSDSQFAIQYEQIP